MLFLPAMDVWIANEPSLEQVLPVDSSNQSKEDILLGDSLDEEETGEEDSYEFKIKPYVLEGSVQNFDPVKRAKYLSESMPKQWCGNFTSFNEGPLVPVKINLSKLESIGQIVLISGDMEFGKFKTQIHGHLNAKSDQIEFIPTSSIHLPGLDKGGSFLGLDGPSLLGWKSAGLQKIGGKLQMNSECNNKLSKASNIGIIAQ